MAFVCFSQIFFRCRVGHNTLFTVFVILELSEAAVSATEAVLGDLTEPDKGIIFALPVAKTWGLTLYNNKTKK